MSDDVAVVPPALGIGVLGPLVVVRSGRSMRLGGARQRAVLARLICAEGRTVSTDQLAAAVWGDSVPSGYVSTLQTYVFHLREALEPERLPGAPPTILRTEAGGYRLELDLGRIALDAHQFEALAGAGRDLLAASRAADAAQRLLSALELWRGEVLADLRPFEFVATYADRMTGLRVDVEELRLDAELALGHHAEVAASAARLIEAHPLREQFHAQRMLALYRSGRQSEALSAYGQLRRILVDELGIEPNQQLQDLHRKILEQHPDLDWHPDLGSCPAGIPEVTPGQEPPAATDGRGRPSGARRAWSLRRFSRRTVVLAAGLAVIVFGGALTAAVWRADESKAQAGAPNSAVEVGTDGRVHASITVGPSPGALVATPSSVWIAEPQSSSITRVDASPRRLVASIPVGADPVALAIDQGQVWVADGSAGKIQRIDPQTNTTVQDITVGHDPAAITGGFGFLWVANQGDGTVTRIDPTGRTAARTIPVGSEPDGIAAGSGAVWVANQFDNTVSRIDPTSLATSTIDVGVGPEGIAVTSSAVWVADSLDLTVARIDLAHNDTVTKVETGDSPTAVVAFNGSIWASNAGDATLSRLDENSGRVTRTYNFGSAPNDLAAAGSTLWVSSKAYASTTHRGGTLTVATADPDDDLSSIDPSVAYYNGIVGGLSEVYDTLVTIRKDSGLTGLDLVPDLAEQLPTISNDGLTYVFQLRPNLTYSDGQPVRATDFRRGIQRTLLVDHQDGQGYYNAIVGVAGCLRRPSACDLSASIATDDQAGTVTFHLVKPDPNLLGALTITGFSTPMPAATPMTRDVGTTPVPGTGPYQIGQFTPNRSLTLVRNLHFIRLSSAAQPAGYPDGIVWKAFASQQAATDAVGAGAGADVVSLGRTTDLTNLLEDYPHQVIRTESFGSHFLVLNAAVAPFNNALARKAVAEALIADPTLATLDHGTASCTIVPIGFPGQPPTCAYQLNRAEAAATVRASGTYGAPVKVYFNNQPPFTQQGTYITDALDQIGYHATLVLEDNYQGSTYDPKTRPVNVEGEAWFPDFPTESQFWIGIECDPGAFLAELGTCNHKVDADAAVALAAQTTNPSQAQLDWQHTYALIDADARLIPIDTPVGIPVLVSPRVGNAEVTPDSALLDQFWVQ